MGLMEDLSKRDTLLETLEKTLEESRHLRGQIPAPPRAPNSRETFGDLRRTAPPALTWPLPL